MADSQMIIKKDFTATFLLHLVMPHASAPADDRLLVAPVRQRQNPSLSGKTLVADVVNKAVYLL
nr:hypothetical protein [Dictyobacter formicarum]